MRYLLSALILLCAAGRLAGQSREFVRVQDGRFQIGAQPYRFVGANFWYAVHLGSSGQSGDRARLRRELDRLQAMGITNLRIMAGSEGPDTEPDRVKPALQPSAGRYDKNLLRGLDFVLAEMGKRDMRAVICLNNFFHWSGGMAQYVSWAGGGAIPYPDRGASWDEFQSFSAKFYRSAEAQEIFRKFIEKIVDRRNRINGRRYRNDPVIMAWQLANEPREFGWPEEYVTWVDSTTRFIRRLAPRQLVSIGNEGQLFANVGNTYTRTAALPAVDYLTIHLWPQNWSWFDPLRAEQTWDTTLARAGRFFEQHWTFAEQVNKPIVLEEFGFPRDEGGFGPADSVRWRDRYFEFIFTQAADGMDAGRPLAGLNVWCWSGEGRPVEAGAMWQRGQPFTGDPPHEKQGWYSVYDTDTGTVELLRRFAARIGSRPAAPPQSGLRK